MLGGDAEAGGLTRFEPGSEIWGLVQVAPDSDVKCSHLWVRVDWHTEGRGDRDGARVGEMDLFQGTLQKGVAVSHEFRFLLPREPWSYAGHYVNIVWELEVDVDVPWSVNPRSRQPFVMAPSAAGAIAAGSPSTGALPAGAPPGTDPGPKFDLWLISIGAQPQDVAAAIRELLPQFDMKQLLLSAGSQPVALLSRVSEKTAQGARARLEMAGASVEVRPSGS